jgi:hypothetical protein
MRDLAALFIHIIANIARRLGPGGTRAVVAESILVKRQLLILDRAHQRTPNLRASDRIVAALCALLIPPNSPGPFRDRYQTVNPVESHMALAHETELLEFSPVHDFLDHTLGNLQGHV